MFWLLIKVLMALAPLVMQAIREGQIKSASQTEVLIALAKNMNRRIEDAMRAGEGPLPNEDTDPNNRANRP